MGQYIYDATGRRLKKQFNGGTPRYYIDGIESLGDTILVHTGYGRLRRNGSSEQWTRDYFLKDHLGSVRVVLEVPQNTQNTSGATYMATMEDGNAGHEEQYFANIRTTRADRPYNYPDVNPVNTKLSKVPGKSEGLKLTLRVMAGDTVDISAKAFYNIDNAAPGRGINITPIVGNILAGLTSPVSAPLGEAASAATRLGTHAGRTLNLAPLADGGGRDNNSVQPRSGINFVLYSNTFDVVDANTGYLPVDDRINRIQTLSSDRIVIKEAGFLEVFVNNDANTPVYYDNMTVTHSGGSNVTEVNNYYPYGMIIPDLSLMAMPGKYNAYKFGARELQRELQLQWEDFGARMYSPVFGRWWTPDPLAEKYYSISPYAYAMNSPTRYIDPDGKKIVDYRGRLMWDNGGWTKYATQEAMRIGIAMRATETGLKTFEDIANSSAEIQLILSPKMMINENMNGDKTLVRGTFNIKEYLLHGNGNIELTKGTITIYEGSVNAEINDKVQISSEINSLIKALPKEIAIDGAIGSVGVHEGIHATPENVKKQIENRNTKDEGHSLPHDVEKKPRQMQYRYLHELLDSFQ